MLCHFQAEKEKGALVSARRIADPDQSIQQLESWDTDIGHGHGY